jgi:hypothetical protein
MRIRMIRVFRRQRLLPEPEPFGAGVDCRPDAEGVAGVQQHAVDEEALAGAVFADDAQHAHWGVEAA